MSRPSEGMPFGAYQLGPSIAVGGMGEVFVATRRGLGGFEKPLALKVLLAHLAEDDEAVRMFLEEARLAARMSHANVVQIFDVGRAQDAYFIAMELVTGVALSRLIARARELGTRIPPDVVLHVAQSLCRGLHHAHELRGADGEPLELVHRDVSPHNVLVSREGDVKLSDFGIAKARSTSSRTEVGAVRGKLEYMAPEQVRGEPLDRRADCFAAAAVIFQLAAGESPFRRATRQATRDAVLQEPPPSLATLRPDLPAALVTAVERALAKERDARFSTALQFAQAIPQASPGAAATLGQLVEQLCQRQVAELHDKTRVTRREPPAATESRPGTEVLPSPSTRRTWIAASAALAVVSVGLWSLLRLGAPPAGTSPPPASAHAPERTPPPGGVGAASVEPSSPAASAPPRPAPPDTSGEMRTERSVSAPPIEASAPSGAPVPATRPHPHPGREHKPGAAATAAVGYLSIDATPWASVRIDGQAVGETPLYRYPFRAGQLKVELINPDTHKSVLRHVTLKTGESASVKADLR